MGSLSTPPDSASAHGSSPAENDGGWNASLRLCFGRQEARTRLVRKSQSGPLTVQRPFYPEGDTCHLYLLHPPGGLVGGDQLRLEANVGKGAHALLTTPGATKFYRSAGPWARQQQRFEIADGGVLEWLPQETILFDGARAELSSHIELHAGAGFIGWEIYCLGRPAARERFGNGQCRFRLALYRDRKPLLLERLNIMDKSHLDRPAGLRGHPVTATLVATGADRDALLATRDILQRHPVEDAGVTLLDDLLVLRCLGPDGEAIKRLLEQVWGVIRPRLLGREPSPPRVWAT